MIKATTTLALFLFLSPCLAQKDLEREIKQIQLEKFYDEICLDFVRPTDIHQIDSGVKQIIIIRHGEPAMNKNGWKDRDEAIRYTKMYDSVGVYDFDRKPICLRNDDLNIVFTSELPRAINTAEKTFIHEFPMESMELFNEFERKIINFPNIKLPRQFWSVTTRMVWMMGFNDKGIESFSQAKHRANEAAVFLDEEAKKYGKTLLFSHGFLNKYIKRYLMKSGYKVIDLDGQKYLGAYYFYKVN